MERNSTKACKCIQETAHLSFKRFDEYYRDMEQMEEEHLDKQISNLT